MALWSEGVFTTLKLTFPTLFGAKYGVPRFAIGSKFVGVFQTYSSNLLTVQTVPHKVWTMSAACFGHVPLCFLWTVHKKVDYYGHSSIKKVHRILLELPANRPTRFSYRFTAMKDVGCACTAHFSHFKNINIFEIPSQFAKTYWSGKDSATFPNLSLQSQI